MKSLQLLAILSFIAMTSQGAWARTGIVHTDRGDRVVNIEEHLATHSEAAAPRGCDPNSGYCPG